MPTSLPFERGSTYLEAFLRPLRLTDSLPLAEWFVSVYSPGNPSGYGFSLSGEAYLNFGVIGAPIVFAIIAYVQRRLMNGAHLSDARAYLSIVFLVAALYALRGDSAQLISTMMYAGVFIGLLSAVRVSPRSVRPTERAVRPSGVQV